MTYYTFYFYFYYIFWSHLFSYNYVFIYFTVLYFLLLLLFLLEAKPFPSLSFYLICYVIVRYFSFAEALTVPMILSSRFIVTLILRLYP